MLGNKKNNKKIGDIGEQITVNHLKRKGFAIIETNYLKKWGEIDVIAEKDKIVHFIEVKTLSYESKAKLIFSVSHETWRPEDQVHQFKLRQIYKALETWVSENNYDGDWQIDVAAVRVVPRETYATIKFIENIIE